MYSAKIRLILALGCATCGGCLVLVAGSSTGWLFLVVSGLLGYGYLRYGTVWLAMRSLRKGDYSGAKRRVAQVSKPARLNSESRAYFELAAGLVAANEGRAPDAEAHLRTSLDYALRTENDRALAEWALAEVLAVRGESTAARSLLGEARKRDCTPDVRRRIEELERSIGPAAATRVVPCPDPRKPPPI
jgi:hypothetical protein